MATGGYSGYSPWAPGTCGTGVGVLLFFVCGQFSWLLYSLLLLVGCLGGVWIAQEAEALFGGKDPGCIVIDEIVGIGITYCAMPMAFWPLLLGFLCFRAFDIYKPFPRLEQLPGGWGIMLDDVAAGICAHLCLRLLLWTLPPSWM